MTPGGEYKGAMTSAELLSRVHAKRVEVEKYVQINARRRRLLVNLVLVAGAVAALLTTPFAAGGKPFADWLQQVLHTSSPSWRLFCLLAALCSMACVVATQMQKAHGYDEHIVRAQELRATLEGLELSITSESVTQRKATGEFMKCLESGSFIEPTR